jgi:PAS domain S-box-containing protein
VELFENLIGNALKYRKPEVPPQIHISASRTDQDWMIAVRDNGIGFDAKDSERIFSVFQRLHGKEFSGSGIGLSICKRIVERRGGRIWADGTPDVGATFYFTIPDSTAGIRATSPGIQATSPGIQATSPGIQATPPMDWLKLLSMIENGKLADEPTIQTGHFDELFKTLDLAQAIVRRLDGTILIWTKGAERLFGWTEAEALGKRLHELLGTEFLVKAVESVLLKTGEWAGELKACKKDGSHVWLATHKVLYRDGSGRPESVIEVHNDVTALKNASQALAETNALANLRLREIEAIYSQAPVGLLHLDTELRFVRINEYLAGINGTPAASHIGRTVSDVLPELSPIAETILRRVLDTRQPIKDEEVWGTTPNYPNAERTWLVSYFPFEGPDGVCLGLNGVVQDITESKKIEIALLETAERLRIATSVAKLGVFVWEADTDRVLWENDRMYDIVGRKREEGPINNQEFLDSVVYAEDAPGYKKALAEAMEPCGFFRHQCRIRRSDGVIRLVEFAGQFDRVSIGQGMRLVGVMSDLTDALGT